RMVSADGRLVPPGPDARPLAAGDTPAVTIENPPGLYGSEEGVVAHNLLAPGASLEPIAVPRTGLPVTRAAYAFDEAIDLKGPLVAAALALMALDTLAVFWMGGLFSRRPRARRDRSSAAAASVALVLAGGLAFALAVPAMAQDRQAS